MPITLTDDASKFDPVPVPAGGDLRTAASQQAAFQVLANRTAWLKALLTNVSKMRGGTVAQMQGLTMGAGNDGECFFVDQAGAEQGVYCYEFAASDTPVAPWVYQPTTSPGRWVHVLYALIGAKPGLASGNRIVSMQQVALDGTNAQIFSTTSTSFVDVPQVQLPIAGCVAGDVLLIDCMPAFGLDSVSLQAATPYAVGQLVAHDGGSDVVVSGSLLSSSTDYSYSTSYRMSLEYTVANAGTVTVKAQLKSSSTSSNAIWAKPTSVRVIQIRP